MGNDLVRALVELITNADDAYDRAGRKGPIQIEAEHFRASTGEYNRVTVRDQASGMTPSQVKTGILVAGARSSGHESGHRRHGLHGRGAKDVSVFGKATFKTIAEGVYTEVTLFGSNFKWDGDSRQATALDYVTIGLSDGGSGTEVTIFVKRSAHSVPLHKNLADRLARHVQLRDIMTDPTTEVSLRDLGRPTESQRLTYQPPYFSEIVLDEHVNVPDYPEAKCHLVIRRSATQFEDDRGASRHSGIVIVGRRAIYDSTYFGLEGRSGALWFSGRLECDYIDALQDDFDDQNDPDVPQASRPARIVPERLNPWQLITRRRDGLERGHPFAERLRNLVEERLQPLADAEEQAANKEAGGATENTRKMLRNAASKLGALYEELARQQQLDVDVKGTTGEELNTPVALMITPDTATLTPEAAKVFSIYAWPEAHEEGAVGDSRVATVRVALPEVAVVATSTIPLAMDKRQPRRLRGTVKVTAQDLLDATTLEVTLGRYSAEAIIDVVEAKDPLPVEAPPRLVFRQEAYSMRVGRRRRLILWAPNELFGTATNKAVIHITTSSLRLLNVAPFEPVETDGGASWYQAEVEVEGAEACKAKVRAEFGGQIAIARVDVTDPEGQNPFDIELREKSPAYPTSGRAELQTIAGVRKLLIWTGHASLARYFGPKMVNQESAICRVLIAEVVADELASDLLSKEEKRVGGATELFSDVHTFESRRRARTHEFLTLAHEVLVPEAHLD
ncbi:MAG TPA: ATP-binding protein [Candidatus Dormibacteraeota bacterium]|nr:ATP-binding protein [Candidatus Dormibacteraeota bacterium]